MKSIVRCRRLSATLVVTFNTLGLQRSTAVCPAACPAGMRRLGMYQVEPRLEVAGLVHGRRVDSGPVVIERTILLYEPPLVRARRLGEPATLTWDLPRASERRRAEKRSKRRACKKHAQWCWRVVASPASAVKITCNKVNMMFNHEVRDLEHQVQRGAKSFGSLVLDVEAHDAESGLSVIRLSSKQVPTHEGTQVPSLRTSCPEPPSSCTSRRPLENFSLPQDCTML